MHDRILLSATELRQLITAGECVTVDCRFEFSDTGKGRAEWLAGHVPGAQYAHLDEDLASPVREHTGRHPLPDPDRFARYLASIGWSGGRLLVAYDEGPNAIAARMWWLMRYFGQPSALLDGGLPAWLATGYSLESGVPYAAAAAPEKLIPDESMVVSARDIQSRLGDPSWLLLDARTSQRFRGEVEMLDTRAGHIPGAENRPFAANLMLNGRFKSPADLHDEFDDLLDGRAASTAVHSCGSGVTACHNLFAMELAGLGRSRLYAGSWSEWIRDPERPIATGY